MGHWILVVHHAVEALVGHEVLEGGDPCGVAEPRLSVRVDLGHVIARRREVPGSERRHGSTQRVACQPHRLAGTGTAQVPQSCLRLISEGAPRPRETRVDLAPTGALLILGQLQLDLAEVEVHQDVLRVLRPTKRHHAIPLVTTGKTKGVFGRVAEDSHVSHVARSFACWSACPGLQRRPVLETRSLVEQHVLPGGSFAVRF
mmetsp:Transcript_44260/g.71658  ORF Transcript_44260/g.71658 Transcript_44260/m.71658 type:complete len:202 (+) Transcript_44260:519-1124(+)